jgi:hypothetical protein
MNTPSTHAPGAGSTAPQRPDLLVPAELAALGGLELVARQVVEGFIAGLHRSPHRGFSVEFAEHRMYQPGDDLRYIDWRMYGRSDRYYIKQFEEETNLRAYLLVDVSASMAWTLRRGHAAAQAVVRQAAGSVPGAAAGRQGDAVGLLAFDAALRAHVAPRGGRRHWHELLRELAPLAGAGRTDAGTALRDLAGRLRRRGLVVLISDLLVDTEATRLALRFLRHRGHEVLVLHLLDPGERELPARGRCPLRRPGVGDELPVSAADMRREYRAAVEHAIDEWRSELAATAATTCSLAPTSRWPMRCARTFTSGHGWADGAAESDPARTWRRRLPCRCCSTCCSGSTGPARRVPRPALPAPRREGVRPAHPRAAALPHAAAHGSRAAHRTGRGPAVPAGRWRRPLAHRRRHRAGQQHEHRRRRGRCTRAGRVAGPGPVHARWRGARRPFWLLRAGEPGEPALAGDAAPGPRCACAKRCRPQRPPTCRLHWRMRAPCSGPVPAAAPPRSTCSPTCRPRAFAAPLPADGAAPPVIVWHPGTAPPPNRAVADVSIGGGLPPAAGERSTVAATITGAGTEPVAVRLVLDGALAAAAEAVPGTSAVLALPALPGGIVTGRVEIDADALPLDDVRHFAVRVLPTPVVALHGDAPFVADALDVLAAAGRVRRGSPGAADIAIHAGGAGLEPGAAAPVLVVLPPATPEELPATNRRLAAAGIGWRFGPPMAGEARFAEPVADPLLRGLPGTRIRTAYPLVHEAPAADSVLLRLADGSPWAVRGERRTGGMFVLLASPLSPEASTIPVSAAMLPLTDRMTGSWATARHDPTDFAPGTAVVLPPRTDAVAAPDGTREPARAGLEYRLGDRPGTWLALAGDSILAAYSVNAPAAASDLDASTGAASSNACQAGRCTPRPMPLHGSATSFANGWVARYGARCSWRCCCCCSSNPSPPPPAAAPRRQAPRRQAPRRQAPRRRAPRRQAPRRRAPRRQAPRRRAPRRLPPRRPGPGRNPRPDTRIWLMHPYLLDAMRRQPAFASVLRELPPPGGRLCIDNLAGSTPSLLVAALARESPNRVWVVVAPSPPQAEAVDADLQALLEPATRRSSRSARRCRTRRPSTTSRSRPARGNAGGAGAGRARVLVTTARALQELADIPAGLAELRLTLAVGDVTFRLDDLAQQLDGMGFERTALVEAVGEYAVRGGIIDLFGFGAPEPVRIELWGDEIASIRQFDILDQRSTGELKAWTSCRWIWRERTGSGTGT